MLRGRTSVNNALLLISCVVILGCVGYSEAKYVRDPSQVRFWILTDMHYDNEYAVGSEAECGMPLCCHNFSTNASTPIKDPAGKWGNFKCDAPLVLVEGVLQEMATVEPNPDFIIWLGDNVKHDIWLQSRQENLEATFNCTQFIKKAFPETRVIPIFGNHEAYPTDQFAPPPGMTWLYSALAEYWKDWIPADDLASFLYAGYYQTATDDGLRVVALNMMYCDPMNFYLQNETTKDPGNQLQWLTAVLTEAHAIGQKVLLIAHIPPGMQLKPGPPNCLPDYSALFRSIVTMFSDTIVAQLYGHTHEDSFLVFRDDTMYRNPLNFGIVTPSLTPYVGHNPAARLIAYNNKTKIFENIYTYWVDLNETNAQDQIIFNLEYELPEAYKMPDLSANSWLDLSERMKYEEDLFNLWNLHYYTMEANHTCGDLCKRFALCAIQNVGSFSDYSACLL
jgi:sphingomyelin phosphodiesterase